MYQTPEHLVQLSKSNIETALTLANITLASTERLMDLQLKTAREALDQSLRGAKALSDVKNVQDLIALQSQSAQPNVEKALSYSRTLYDLASETQARINKLVEARISALSGELITAFDTAAKSAPAGSEAAIAAFKSALTAANNVYDSVTRAARQAADVTAQSVPNVATKAAKKKAH